MVLMCFWGRGGGSYLRVHAATLAGRGEGEAVHLLIPLTLHLFAEEAEVRRPTGLSLVWERICYMGMSFQSLKMPIWPFICW